MKQPYMEAYVKQIVQSCHKRDIHAMGGMSAFIPSGRGDSEYNKEIQQTVFADKTIEILHGCDGAWVAHPALIEPVQTLFKTSLKGKDHQKHFSSLSLDEQQSSDLFVPTAGSNDPFTRKCFERNVDVAVKYLTRWLSGNGAVALYGLMEDLATAEISSVQLRNWLNHKIISVDDYQRQLNISMSEKTASDPRVRHILETYVLGDARFLVDVAGPALSHDGGFVPITFTNNKMIKKPKSGTELTKQRGTFLKTYLSKNESYGFLGTSNGVSAVNVVAGGGGRVGPYAGGWQSNAMKNRLNMCLPDTLHVAPEDCANCANEVNEHLYRAHLVQAEQGLNTVNYEDVAFLADLEQGWNTPEKTRIAVRRCIEAGVNVILIEDQGDKKRCGHLGDKELNSFDDYAVIMRSANLAAHEMGVQDHVTFVARTDAYSAKRIHYSEQLRDPKHPEHKFIDWLRGPTPDGKYLYLKAGINDATGRRWGLDLAIYRGTKVVENGLASHVWMETPDADLQVAKDFLNNVNSNLSLVGKRAYGLYNHSPSFDWDIKFIAEAKPLAEAVARDIRTLILNNNYKFSFEVDDSLVSEVHQSLSKNGNAVQGDDRFSDDRVRQMLPHLMDYVMGEHIFYEQFDKCDVTRRAGSFDSAFVELRKNAIFRPIDAITDIIVDERLRLFGPMLASFGYNMHLITLPEFHVTAFRMHDLASRFKDSGIEAFVTSTQRPERIRMTKDPSYTYYKHQTATGTGVEAAFNLAVGSSNVNALSSSTESDDLKKRT
jgi:isocitrate lyase